MICLLYFVASLPLDVTILITFWFYLLKSIEGSWLKLLYLSGKEKYTHNHTFRVRERIKLARVPHSWYLCSTHNEVVEIFGGCTS